MIEARRVIAAVLVVIFLTSCSAEKPAGNNERLLVVASTTIVGDVVRQVGGDDIQLTVLTPVGSDPHTFEPRPQDIAAISQAEVIFINGLGLEESLEPVLKANATGKIIQVSDGVEILDFNPGQIEAGAGHTGGGDDKHALGDPHTWMDPNNVMVWVKNIQTALTNADPAHAEAFRSNADRFLSELEALDAWVRTETDRLPLERRKLVSDHASFGYFARRYGFEQAGLIVASLSSNASPSAQELAQIEDAIRSQGIPVVFLGATVNPTLAQQIANDTGAKLVRLYTGSLGAPGSGADTYLNFMRYDVQAIVDALK